MNFKIPFWFLTWKICVSTYDILLMTNTLKRFKINKSGQFINVKMSNDKFDL